MRAASRRVAAGRREGYGHGTNGSGHVLMNVFAKLRLAAQMTRTQELLVNLDQDLTRDITLLWHV